MPNILMLESCTSYSQLYFRSKQRPINIHIHSEMSGTPQDIFIFQSLKKIFPTKESWRTLDGLGVIIGPGRFNAVRVSCAIISTLQAISGLPIYTLTAYDLLDRMTLSQPQKGSAIFAKKGFVYYRDRFSKGEGALMKIEDAPRDSVYWGPLQEDSVFNISCQQLDLNVFYDAILENATDCVVEPLALIPAYCALV